MWERPGQAVGLDKARSWSRLAFMLGNISPVADDSRNELFLINTDSVICHKLEGMGQGLCKSEKKTLADLQSQ